jgi:ribosomal protein S18 acetylase RimI-like enzyme
VIRRWMPDDIDFLWEVLYLSLHVADGADPFPRAVLNEPAIAHYLAGFGERDGDDAVIAVDGQSERIGAAFCRRFTSDDPSYGFVDENTPELSMALVGRWRGRGVGGELLMTLLEDHPRMSLSVDPANVSARALYRRMGFVDVGSNGGSITMLRLSDAAVRDGPDGSP